MSDLARSHSKEYLGRGLSFPLRLSLQGGLLLSAADQSVEESIRIILRTEPGERVYRPEFGCRLSELVFAPLNSQTLVLIRLYVQEALKKWEPRIILDGILLAPDPLRGRIDITINYHLVETYEARSLVYPFYLRSAEEAAETP